MIWHSETAKMSKTLCFFILGGQLAGSGGRTLFSDSLKLQLYQHRDQLILLKVEVYLKPPHLNIALWVTAASSCKTKFYLFEAFVCFTALHLRLRDWLWIMFSDFCSDNLDMGLGFVQGARGSRGKLVPCHPKPIPCLAKFPLWNPLPFLILISLL